MQIVGFVSAGVRDLHHVAVAALAAGKDNSSVRDGLHRSSYWRRVVRPQMGPADFQNRMVAMQAEMRADARGKTQGRTKESFLQ